MKARDRLLKFLLNYISSFLSRLKFLHEKKNNNCEESILNTEIESDESYIYVI